MNKAQKLFTFLIAAVMAVFLFPKIVEAKRGCCSSHGGVDCGAGAQSNGKVICYDGWRSSSCLYSEMVKCGGSSSSTTEYKPTAPVAPVVPVVIPEPSPTPVIIQTIPSPIPAKPSPKPSPTSSPTPSPSPIPSPISSPTLLPTPSPEVLGEKTESSSGGVMPELTLLGGFGYIMWRAFKQKWPFHAK